MKELYKLKIEKKYGEWYYSIVEGKAIDDIVYYLYNEDKKLVGKLKAYFQLREAILSGDIKAYQNKHCYFGEYETYVNRKLVSKDKEQSLISQ